MVKRSKAVTCPQRAMRMMSVVVDGTGTASLGGICANDMTLTDNGTGDYTLTMKHAFKQLPQVLATPVTDNRICKIGTVTASAVQILTEDLSGSAADADFHVILLGSDTLDQI
jgi:hypothetical protein